MPHQPPEGDQVEELLALVAHELRRPLTALLGALATVQQRGPALPAAQQRELLGMARRQGEQLQRLLDQLLVAAALDRQATGTVGWSLVDVAALAREAALAARLAHASHRISIEVAGPLLVHGDPLAIGRILGNLLDNAAIHSPTGSPIRVAGRQVGRQAVLTVRDRGPGIPAADRARVFQRYTRLDRQTNPTGGGLGVGLYVARQLAHANHGELQVTDPPGGRGVQFELYLPLASPAPDLRRGTPTDER